MNERPKPIEEFFLESLLKLCLISVLIVMAVDFYFTRFVVTRSAVIDFAILFAIVASYLLYKLDYFIPAVLLIAFITMAAMFYQSIVADSITTSSMAVVMVIGFGFSVLLKGRVPLVLHGITLCGMAIVFAWLELHPLGYNKPDASDIIVAGVTYCILYFLIASSSWLLKKRYDETLEILVFMQSNYGA